MNKTWSWLLVNVLGTVFACFPLVIHAATLTVNTTTDAVDTAAGDGICATSGGTCSLRAAVQEANALAGTDTINVSAGTITLSTTGSDENLAATGDLDVTSTMIISGHNTNGTTIDGNLTDRIFEVRSGGNLTLSNVTLQNGKIDVSGSNALGGAILNSSTLTVTTSAFLNNIVNSTDLNSKGGAVENDLGATATLTNITLSGNNTALSANGFGGAISNSGTLTLNYATVSANTASFGGGIENANPPFSVTTVKNSIVASNIATGGLGGSNCYGGMTSDGYNIETSSNTCNFTTSTDQNSVSTTNLNLGSIADNGGPTKTFALGAGSVALDLIPTTSCTVTTDQRGISRPQGSKCDVGAYERDQTAPVITLVGSDPQTVSCTTSSYSDAGASATDNFDGSVLASSNSSTAVLSTTPGTYTVTYSAQDRVSNSTTATRTIILTGTTYYRDSDGDGIGTSTTTTASCSTTVPTGYATTSTDCSDSDATVTTNQTYYQDSDNDGLGSDTTISTCSSTAPTGYVANTNDTNDTIKNNGVEINGDAIDNDGDGMIDEVNTIAENGIHPEYGSYNPSDKTSYATAVTAISGAKNGKIKITFADNSVYSYTIFNVSTDTKTKLKFYNDKGYLIAVHPKGKKITLLNVYTGAILATKKLSDSSYKNIGLKLLELQDKLVCITTTQQTNGTILLSLVKVKLADETFKKKSQVSLMNSVVAVGKTNNKDNTVQLRNDDATVLASYHVTEEFDLVEK